MNRRCFLQTSTALSRGLAFTTLGSMKADELAPKDWRAFEVILQIDILKPAGVTRVWALVASLQGTPFQRTFENTLQCEAGKATVVKSDQGAHLVAAEFPP